MCMTHASIPTTQHARHYNTYRDYSPEIGRYIESDPVGLTGGINVYRYAVNDSLRYDDPFGLCPEDCSNSRQLAWDYYAKLQSLFPSQYPKKPWAIVFGPLPPNKGGLVSPLVPTVIVLPNEFCDLTGKDLFDFYWAIAHEGLHINQSWIDLYNSTGDNPMHDLIDEDSRWNTKTATGRWGNR